MIRIGLHSGGVLTIDPLDVSQVVVEDIAFGLSNVGRFGGQVVHPVGEHEVKLAWWWRAMNHTASDSTVTRVVRAILIHDAVESLGVGDVNRFIKRKYAKPLRRFDNRVTKALWPHLSGSRVAWKVMHELITPYDEAIGTWEAFHHGFPYDKTKLPLGPIFPHRPEHWTAVKTRVEWLNLWHNPTGAVQCL